MSQSWWPAPEVEEVAKTLIEAHHPHLIDEPLHYVFCQDAEKIGGAFCLGTARVVSGREAWLWMRVFGEWTEAIAGSSPIARHIITIWSDGWKNLEPNQRVALVDHELCHCIFNEGKDGKTAAIKPHDLEEFHAIVERHGAWREDITTFVHAVQSGQRSLFVSGNEGVSIDIRHRFGGME